MKKVISVGAIVLGLSGSAIAQDFTREKLEQQPKQVTSGFPLYHLYCADKSRPHSVIYSTNDKDTFLFYESNSEGNAQPTSEGRVNPWLRFNRGNLKMHVNTDPYGAKKYDFVVIADTPQKKTDAYLCDLFANLRKYKVSPKK